MITVTKTKSSPSKIDIFEALFYDKDHMKRLRLIRRRKSYEFWNFQYSALRHQGLTKRQTESLLTWAYSLLNTRYAFKSAYVAGCVKESIDQVVQDHRSGRLR